MAKKRSADPKVDALRETGCLNPRPEAITDPLFLSSNFFDQRDLVQVKYEMVRRVHTDGQSVSTSARAFGFSRPSFYQAQAALDTEGLAGLLPKKRGPRRSHKLDTGVIEYLQEQLSEQPPPNSVELARRVQERFQLVVHPRSIERALARQEKKQR